MRRAGGRSSVVGRLWPIVVLIQTGLAVPPDKDDPDDGSFGFTKPVACIEIKGYNDYVELSGATLTSDEKLLVYFRPRHFRTTRIGREFEAHLVEDVRVRKRGDKTVIWSKLNIVNYQPRTPIARPPIYIHNKLSLKGLIPGQYELEIVLHDRVALTPPVERKLFFEVIPAEEEPEPKKPDVEKAPDK